MEFEHKKFGKCVLTEINQKMLEDFHREMIGKETQPLSVWRGDSVRAAVKCGFMVEPKWTLEDVESTDQSPVPKLESNPQGNKPQHIQNLGTKASQYFGTTKLTHG